MKDDPILLEMIMYVAGTKDKEIGLGYIDTFELIFSKRLKKVIRTIKKYKDDCDICEDGGQEECGCQQKGRNDGIDLAIDEIKKLIK